MKIILSSFLTSILLLGASSIVFAATKKGDSTSTHKRTASGKHRGTGSQRNGKTKSNIPKNGN